MSKAVIVPGAGASIVGGVWVNYSEGVTSSSALEVGFSAAQELGGSLSVGAFGGGSGEVNVIVGAGAGLSGFAVAATSAPLWDWSWQP